MRKFPLALALILLPQVSLAVSIGLSGNPAGTDPEILVQPPGMVQLHVVVRDTPPGGIREVRFAVEPFPVPFPNSFWLGDEHPYPATTGNSQTGVTVNLGGCFEGPIHVLTVNLWVNSFSQCDWLETAPRPGSQHLEVVDCAGNVVSAYSGAAFLTQTRFEIFDRFPADGATDVSTDVVLRWNENGCLPPGVDVYAVPVYFGTTPNPPEVGWQTGFLPMTFDPGPLAAGTTYYWSFFPWFGYSFAPVWSFTTAGNVAVTRSSWAKVKTLYR